MIEKIPLAFPLAKIYAHKTFLPREDLSLEMGACFGVCEFILSDRFVTSVDFRLFYIEIMVDEKSEKVPNIAQASQ